MVIMKKLNIKDTEDQKSENPPVIPLGWGKNTVKQLRIFILGFNQSFIYIGKARAGGEARVNLPFRSPRLESTLPGPFQTKPRCPPGGTTCISWRDGVAQLWAAFPVQQ